MRCDIFGLMLGSNAGRCVAFLQERMEACLSFLVVLSVHSVDNNITVYRGEKLLASTGFLCGQDLDSENYRCVGAWSHVNACSPKRRAQATTILGYLFYYNEQRKIQCI